MNAPTDTSEFIEMLDSLGGISTPGVRELFDEGREVIVARAPGRLDLMGGIADYSGSLVLQMPIAEATHVALQRHGQHHTTHTTRTIKIVSLSPDATREAAFEMRLDDFQQNGQPISYLRAREFFGRDKSRHWAAYVAGVFLVLMRERGVRFDESVSMLISSRVPEGKGVSSSAAIEVASMSAVCAGFGIELAPRDLALLCQKVENLIVGAPCGVMDQMTSVCGEAGKLLALLCQPAELQGTILLPQGLAVWGLDSGVRHSVGAGDYGSVRTGAFMGYRMLAQLAGLEVASDKDGQTISISDSRWGGFLSNVTSSEFESYVEQLPEYITGAEFLARYQGTTDTVTRVATDRTYAVRKPTAHAIHEHFRVRAFAELLPAEASERRDALLGELMYQSHASYSACGLGSTGTDLLVALVRKLGAGNGLYGAKITGGGSGGTVAVLGRQGADAAIKMVAEKYHEATNYSPYLFTGSSSGSAAFGFIKLPSPSMLFNVTGKSLESLRMKVIKHEKSSN